MTLTAIQGVRGSYSEEAAIRILGHGADILECADFEETFAALSAKKADFAVVPVRNKIVGEIEAAVSLLESNRMRVLDELPLKVKHVLAGFSGARFEDLQTVRSHIEALKQCRRFLTDNPQLKQVIGADTASSVRRIVEEGAAANAAIGSQRAAEMYGAAIIMEDIADDLDNWTTFYLLEIKQS
jgi:prephenate dehydratase